MKNNKKNAQNKMVLDANGDELIFPELTDNDTPSVGDKIYIVDENGNERKFETGSRLLPDASSIHFENGEVTDINSNLQLKKSLTSSCGKKVVIVAKNKKEPYKVGNSVLIDGKSMRFGTYLVNNLEIVVSKGEIVRVCAIKKSKTNRVRFK